MIPVSPAERQLLNHVRMWGSDGYPVQRVGRSWQWVDAFGVGGAPTCYRTKREAVAAFEGWLDQMRERLGEEAQARACSNCGLRHERQGHGCVDGG